APLAARRERRLADCAGLLGATQKAQDERPIDADDRLAVEVPRALGHVRAAIEQLQRLRAVSELERGPRIVGARPRVWQPAESEPLGLAFPQQRVDPRVLRARLGES